MNHPTILRRQMLLASVVIIGILLAQAVQTFYVLCPFQSLAERFGLPRLACERAMYPFTQYPMYSPTFSRETPVHFYEIYAVLKDGTERRLLPADLGFGYWDFLFFSYMLQQDKRDTIAGYAQRCQEYLGISVAAFRLEDVPWTLETSPPSRLERRIVRIIPVES